MKGLSLNLGIRRSVSRPEAASQWPRKIFETLGGIFVLRMVLLRCDGRDQPNLVRLASTSHRGDPLWAGEEILDDVLTHFTPGDDALISELGSRVTGSQTIELTAHGALLHRASGTAAPAFYGRWRHTSWLETFVTVYFTWNEHERELEIAFPLGGYPLTSSRFVGDELQDGDGEAARENARSIVDELAKLRRALALAPDEVTWTQFGDYKVWYPEDAEACERIWLPKLRAG
jgi:hypothetical protein